MPLSSARLLAVALLTATIAACGSDSGTGLGGGSGRDTLPPALVLSVKPFPIAHDSDFIVEGTVHDAGGVESVSVDGTPVTLSGNLNSFSLTLHSPANLAPVTVTAQASDRAGNHTDTSVVFKTRAQRFEATFTGLPAADSVLQQLEFVVNVTGPAQTTTSTFITVDGTTGIAWMALAPPYMVPTPMLHDGTHSIELLITPDADVHAYDTTFTVQTHIAAVNYQAVVLPPLPGDYDAGGTDMNDSGLVVGWSAPLQGTRRPVRWANGAAVLLPMDSGTVGWADAVNVRGDIVGTVQRVDSAFELAALWLAPQDTLQVVARTPEALRINSTRTVLLAGGRFGDLDPSLYDIASGALTTLWTQADGGIVDLNDAGGVVGFTNPVYQFLSPKSFGPVTIDSLPPMPLDGLPVYYRPVDLNDAGETLLTENDRWILSSGAQAQFITPFVGQVTGGGSARMNNTGLVAAVAPDHTIYIWDRAAGVTRRVSADAGWSFDGISRISDTGVILAHGQNTTSGAHGAVVLTPIQ